MDVLSALLILTVRAVRSYPGWFRARDARYTAMWILHYEGLTQIPADKPTSGDEYV